MWREAAILGVVWTHGWDAAARSRDDCGRAALVEKRATERGAARAMFLKANIVNVKEGYLNGRQEMKGMEDS